MLINYLSCDGETEVEEEVIKIEFYEYEDRITGELMQGMECKRPDGDIFVVDCNKVYGIEEKGVE